MPDKIFSGAENDNLRLWKQVGEIDGKPVYAPSVFAVNAAAGDTDANLVGVDVTTSSSPGTWVSLMPSDSARLGARLQMVSTAGNVFIKQFDTGLPSPGKQPGETQIGPAPMGDKFDFLPKRRYVIRGDMASLIVSLQTW